MKKKLKVVSLFSGIGAFEKALENLKIKYELLAFSEIDKGAINSYCAIHNVDKNLILFLKLCINYNKSFLSISSKTILFGNIFDVIYTLENGGFKAGFKSL